MKTKNISFKVLKNLATKLYKSECRRNVTASFAIALSAMLVILVLSTIVSITNILQREKQMLLGSKAEGLYLSTSYHWYEELRDNGKFDEVELVANMGTYETEKSKVETNYILYAKEKTAAWNFNELLEGTWATKEGEIVVDELFIERNGGNIQVGDTLEIRMKTYVEDKTYELKVTGICAANYVKDEARIYVPKDYFWRIRSGALATYCRFEQGKYSQEDLMNILREINPNPSVPVVANTLLPEGKQSQSVLVMIACVLGLTGLCAGLMVYAIYYISVVKNVVQYGQLKLVGVKESQIRLLVWLQALRQYIIGLPIGCFAGCAVGYLVMPLLASAVGLEYNKTLTIEPIYFLYAALIAFVVMYFGIRKPMKIVAKIPPIHTVGFSSATKRKIGNKKSTKFTLNRFALKNLGIRKKKTGIVSFSMFLSIMLFVITANLINSMNVDALLEKVHLPADVVIADKEALEALESGYYYSQGEGLPDELQQKITDICKDGEVTNYYNIEAIFYLNEFETEACAEILTNMKLDAEDTSLVERIDTYYATDEPVLWSQDFFFYDYEQLTRCEVLEGELDREKYESGEYVIAVAFNENGNTVYHAGDEVMLCDEVVDMTNNSERIIENGVDLDIKSQKTKTYKVLAVVRDYYGNKFQANYDEDVSFKYILPTNCMEQMFQKPTLQAITVDTESAEYLDTIEPLVAECIAGMGEEISYSSRNAYKKELEEFGMLIAFIGNGLAFLVGFMSMVNFINNCVSGIAERKEEFSTLHAIGLTKEQLIKVLRLENLYTIVFAIIAGLLFGHIVSWIGIYKVSEVLSYLVFDITIVPGIVLSVFLCLLALVYPNHKTDVWGK